jgi:hypothetical protein
MGYGASGFGSGLSSLSERLLAIIYGQAIFDTIGQARHSQEKPAAALPVLSSHDRGGD